MNPRADAVWDDGRCAELQAFIDLVREVGAINRGTGCLERIAHCIALADELDRSGDLRRKSFRAFLHDLALDDRFPSRHAKQENNPTPDGAETHGKDEPQ